MSWRAARGRSSTRRSSTRRCPCSPPRPPRAPPPSRPVRVALQNNRPERGDEAMPKYLWEASYSSDGVKGVVKEGGTGRRAEAKNLVEVLGGTLEAFYFAFGDADAVIIADLPDEEAASAVTLAVNADDRI